MKSFQPGTLNLEPLNLNDIPQGLSALVSRNSDHGIAIVSTITAASAILLFSFFRNGVEDVTAAPIILPSPPALIFYLVIIHDKVNRRSMDV